MEFCITHLWRLYVQRNSYSILRMHNRSSRWCWYIAKSLQLSKSIPTEESFSFQCPSVPTDTPTTMSINYLCRQEELQYSFGANSEPQNKMIKGVKTPEERQLGDKVRERQRLAAHWGTKSWVFISVHKTETHSHFPTHSQLHMQSLQVVELYVWGTQSTRNLWLMLLQVAGHRGDGSAYYRHTVVWVYHVGWLGWLPDHYTLFTKAYPIMTTTVSVTRHQQLAFVRCNRVLFRREWTPKYVHSHALQL